MKKEDTHIHTYTSHSPDAEGVQVVDVHASKKLLAVDVLCLAGKDAHDCDVSMTVMCL